MKDTSCATQMTIKHILSQTSGFPNHTFTDLLDNGYQYENIKSSLSGVALAAKPGQIYTYQNVVYSLIGDILQKTTGEDYNHLLQDKIFVPLRMNEASTDFGSFCNNPNTALPHLRYGSSWKAKPKNDRYYSVSPASGVNASASDMAQWLLALTGYYPEVIPEQAIRDISTACIETPRKSAYVETGNPWKKHIMGSVGGYLPQRITILSTTADMLKDSGPRLPLIRKLKSALLLCLMPIHRWHPNVFRISSKCT
jgi:beta-lactamase class C